MIPRILATTSVAALTAFLTGPAFADVTPEQVWQSWKDLGAASGQTITTGSESKTDDKLTLNDVKIEIDEDDSKASGTIPQVTLRDMGDGRVEVTMSDSYQFQMTVTRPDGEVSSSNINVVQSGLSMIASGTPEAMNHDFTADSMTVKIADVIEEGEPRDMDIGVTMSKLAVAYQITPGDLMAITTTLASQSVSFTVRGTEGDSDASFDMKGEMVNLAGATSTSLPQGGDTTDLGKQLARGMTIDASFTYDSGSLNAVTTDEESGATTIESQSKGGNLKVAMNKDRIAYGGAATGVSMKATGASIPFPELSLAYNQASFDLQMPIAKSDVAKDFTLQTQLEGVTISNEVWAMFDPQSTLPRDPATLIVSLKGKAKPLFDMFDKDSDAMSGDSSPVELETLDIEALQLTVAGGEFKGNGSLAFDNTKEAALGGVTPMPTGKLSLSLTGVTTLLTKLQALGLVEAEIPMTFGMFAGMLAKPGPTPDSFVAEVEFKEDGQILSNGNPLPF